MSAAFDVPAGLGQFIADSNAAPLSPNQRYPTDPVDQRIVDLKTLLWLMPDANVSHFCKTEILRLRSQQLADLPRTPPPFGPVSTTAIDAVPASTLSEQAGPSS